MSIKSNIKLNQLWYKIIKKELKGQTKPLIKILKRWFILEEEPHLLGIKLKKATKIWFFSIIFFQLQIKYKEQCLEETTRHRWDLEQILNKQFWI